MAVLAAAASLGSLAMVSPAGAADQTVVGIIGDSVAISTAPTASVTFPALPAAGTTSVSGGSIAVTGNLAWVLTVKAEKATMTKYASGAYVNGTALATPMTITPTLTSAVGSAVPTPVAAVATTDLPLATGILGTGSVSLQLSQVTLPTDAPATYRNVLTYTAAASL